MSETRAKTDLAYATATELVAALSRREVGALELTDAAIARIEARDGEVNAVVVRDFDQARQAARTADAALARGEPRPLLGLPMTVKESYNVEGLPTTWGSPAFKGWIAPTDATAVRRLKAAGAVILGKTNVPPFLADIQSANPIYGRTNNPWDLGRTPGGSSGGAAAALAAGFVSLELGSDIGGSIRVPAAYCGVFGHKPSYGLVPSRGHAPPGLDGAPVPIAVCGPLARSAADLALALGVVAGPDEEAARAYRLALPEPRRARLADHRILVIDHHPSAVVDDEPRAALHALADRLDALGAQVDRGSDLVPDLAAAHETFMALLNTAISRGSPGAQPVDAHKWMGLLDDQLRLRRQWDALFARYDVVLTPNTPTPAFPHMVDVEQDKRLITVNGEQVSYFAGMAWQGLALVAELPATAVPIGLSRSGLPMSMQVVGPYLEDLTPIGFAGQVEREFGGFQRPPRF